MRKPKDKVIFAFIFILIMGCVHAKDGRNCPDVPPEVKTQRSLMKPIVEALFMNHNQLKYLYSDIHELARGPLFRSDRQLDYVQKAALYMNEAYLIGHSEWKLLSIMEYIKPEVVQDYYTLRKKGLTEAIQEIQYSIKQIELYKNFINDRAAVKIIQDAVGVIDANIYMMNKLLELVTPLSASEFSGHGS